MTAARDTRRVAWAAATAVAVRGVTGSLNVASSLRWLHHHAAAGSDTGEGQRPHFVLVFPVLREQRLLAATVDHAAAMTAEWGDASLAVVTTEREHHERSHARAHRENLVEALHTGWQQARLVAEFAGVLPDDQLIELARQASGRSRAECAAAVEKMMTAVPSTPQLATELVAAAALRDGVEARHYHHPHPGAGMVHQVNHAAEAEIRRLVSEGVARQRIWIAVYNADSRPEPASLSTAAATIAERAAQGSPARVMQQSALFTANLARLGDGAAGAFLTGAALLQSRWTLAREVPRLRRQARQARHAPRWARWWPRLAHCVGHGLFVRADAFATWGGLPEATMNEDLAFGYLQCADGTPIEALPVLEWADTAEIPRGVIR